MLKMVRWIKFCRKNSTFNPNCPKIFLIVTVLFCIFSPNTCICDSYSVFCFFHVCICESVSLFRFPMFLFVTGCCSFFFQCLYLWQLFCIGKRWKILPRDPEQGTLARNILIHKLKTFSYLQIILIHKLKTVSYSQITTITIRKKQIILTCKTKTFSYLQII